MRAAAPFLPVGSRPAAGLSVRPCSTGGAVGRGDETRPAQRETAAADRPYSTDRPVGVNRYVRPRPNRPAPGDRNRRSIAGRPGEEARGADAVGAEAGGQAV